MILTGDMDDRVIPDVMNDVLLPQGRYPENFVLISQWEVSHEGGYLVDLTGDMEDRVIPDVMNDNFLPLGRFPKRFFVDMSIRSVSGRGDQERGYLDDVEAS